MRRGAKPAKAKVEAKPPGARKSRKKEDSGVRDLEKRLAEALEQRTAALEQQTATAEILGIISRSPDAQPVFDAIAVNALRLCDAEGVVVARYDGALLHVAAHHNVNPEVVDRLKRQYPMAPDRHNTMGRAILDGSVVQVVDLQTTQEFSGSIARQFGARGHVSIPLLLQGRAVGAIGISRKTLGPFSDQQIAMLKTFADQAVIAIENVRLFTELEEKNKALTQAHAQVTEALARQTATSEILRVISGSPTDVQPVLDAVAENAARLCGADDAVIHRVDGGRLTLVAHFGGMPTPPEHASMPIAREMAVGSAVLDRRTLHIHDMAEELRRGNYPASRPFVERLSYRTLLYVPLVQEDVAVGVIVMRRAKVQPFTEQQIDLVKTFADQAVIAIENARLFNETKEALEQQTATAEILRVIASSPTNLQPVMDVVGENAARVCGATDALVYRLEDGGLRLVAAYGDIPAVRSWVLDRGHLSSRAVIDRKPVHIHDIAAAEAEFPISARTARTRGTRTCLATPLLREGVPIGVIAIRRMEVRPFSDDQIALLKTFADQAVIAIENVRLFKELEARNRDLTEALEQQTATAEILRVISSSPTDLLPVMNAVAESAARLCEATDAHVFQKQGDLLRAIASHGALPLARHEIPISRQSVIGRAVCDRRPIHVDDLAVAFPHEFPEAGRLKEMGYRTILVTPLLREGEPIGAIVIRRTEVRPFSSGQVALLATFADQAVIAIENVRLFKELEARNNDLRVALEQQTATSEILRVISSSPTDIQPVFEAIVTSGRRLCLAHQCLLVGFDGEMLTWLASDNFSTAREEALRSIFPYRATRAGTTGRVVLDRAVVHIPDVLDDPDHGHKDVSIRAGARAQLAVPMFRENDVIGALHVARPEPGPFSDAQIALLQTFADQAVIAIENVRLFTELQTSNRELTTALDTQTATSDILRVISRSQTDVQPVFDAIVTSAVRLLRAYTGIVTRVVGKQLEVAALTSIDAAGDAAVRAAYPRPLDSEGAHTRAIRDRTPVNFADMQTDPRILESGRTASRVVGYRSFVAVPLVRHDEAVGTIAVTRREPGGFTDDEIALLKTFADQAVIAIENVRLFTELQASNRELTTALDKQTATSEILRAIAHAPTDTQPVFDTIVRSAAALCHAAVAGLFLSDGQTVHLPANYGSSPEALSAVRALFPRPLDMETTGGIAILTGSVVHVLDSEAPSAPEMVRQSGRVGGFRSLVTVPMLRRGAAVGALGVYRREPGRFSDGEVELLKTFADQAVIAIENVRLFQELETRNRALTEALEQQTATSEILRVISSSPTDIQPVFDTIVESAGRLCEAERAFVHRFDDQLLRIVATHNVSPELKAFVERNPITPGRQSVAGRAALEHRTVHIRDVLDDDEITYGGRYVDSIPIRTMLAVPMLRAGELLGVIMIYRHELRPFTDSQIALLETFAHQAVIAVENVRLFKELEARTADLTRSVDQLTALGEVGRAVSSTLDLETVLTTIVSRAVELSRLDGGVVFEYDEGDHEFVQRAQAETGGALAAPRRPTRIQKGEGVVGRTAITLEPVQVFDITAPGAYVGPNRENLIESGVKAILAVPMVREGQLIGCLGVTRNQPGEFPTEIIALLRTFATQSALAIQNARLFHEIEVKSRQLEAASQHKSEFLANMSHELRTPLNAIIGFSEVLSERMFGDLNEKQDEYLRDIYASGTHLLSLINDILDLSKIEAGRMELELTDFDLQQAIDNALTLVRERAGRRGITLEHSVDERLGEIRGDERKVKQVLLNLLSNALKFTPEGGRVAVRAGMVDGMAEISVTDTGVGIAPEDQGAIFEEFRQVGTADKKAEGTGLGLTLCRKFVELHSGRIWVRSQVGVGSTFAFTIPVRRGD